MWREGLVLGWEMREEESGENSRGGEELIFKFMFRRNGHGDRPCTARFVVLLYAFRAVWLYALQETGLAL